MPPTPRYDVRLVAGGQDLCSQNLNGSLTDFELSLVCVPDILRPYHLESSRSAVTECSPFFLVHTLIFLYSAATRPGIDTSCIDGTLTDFWMSIFRKNVTLRQTLEALDAPKWGSPSMYLLTYYCKDYFECRPHLVMLSK